MNGILYLKKPHLRKHELRRQNRALYQKVKRIKKTIDNEIPNGYYDYKEDKKKPTFVNMRKRKIERDNIHLLNKLNKIAKKPVKNPYHTKMSDEQYISIVNTKTRSSVYNRQVKLQRIQEENLMILERIQKQKPSIKLRAQSSKRGAGIGVLAGKERGVTAEGRSRNPHKNFIRKVRSSYDGAGRGFKSKENKRWSSKGENGSHRFHRRKIDSSQLCGVEMRPSWSRGHPGRIRRRPDQPGAFKSRSFYNVSNSRKRRDLSSKKKYKKKDPLFILRGASMAHGRQLKRDLTQVLCKFTAKVGEQVYKVNIKQMLSTKAVKITFFNTATRIKDYYRTYTHTTCKNRFLKKIEKIHFFPFFQNFYSMFFTDFYLRDGIDEAT